MDNTQRIGWLDISKGIGIILVVFGHVIHDIELSAGTSISKVLTASDLFIYSFHMPLFFFIAGCLLKKQLKKQSTNILISNKVSTLLYPYIIWSLIQGSIEIFMAQQSGPPVTVTEVIGLFWAPRAHFWFLYILFFMAFISIILDKIVPRFSFFVHYLLCFLFIIYPIPLAGFSVFYLYFVVGLSLSSYILQWSQKISGKRVIMSILLLLLYELIVLSNYVYTYKIQYFLAPAGIYCVVLLSHYIGNVVTVKKEPSLLSRYFSYLGKNSLVIYLTHVLVYKALFFVLGYAGVHNELILLIIGSSIAIALPPFVYKYGKPLKSKCLFDGKELINIFRK